MQWNFQPPDLLEAVNLAIFRSLVGPEIRGTKVRYIFGRNKFVPKKHIDVVAPRESAGPWGLIQA